MEEYSRIIIEDYCRTHDSAKSRFLRDMLELADNFEEPSDPDAIRMERMIEREKNQQLKEAMEDLDNELFGW